MQRFRSLSTLILTATFLVAAPVFASGNHGSVIYDVTIVNLTRGQVFTPILVASHKPRVRLFDVGAAASPELAELAESGAVGPLSDLLDSLPAVKQVRNSGDVLPPGASVTVRIKTRGRFNTISAAAMLVPTNDAFVAIQGVRVPAGHGERVVYARAYDAGSETNDESCANIPGPPDICAGVGVSLDDKGEGYVHIHAGIHGIGDLIAADHDWRNPVARITIRRSK